MSAAFYRLRPASSVDYEEQQRKDQQTQEWAWLAQEAPAEGPGETVNLTRFQDSCDSLERRIKNDLVTRAALSSLYVTVPAALSLLSIAIASRRHIWEAFNAACHVIVLPPFLITFILHAPRFSSGWLEVFNPANLIETVLGIAMTARTMLCLQSFLGYTEPRFVDILAAFGSSAIVIALMLMENVSCEIRWRVEWLRGIAGDEDGDHTDLDASLPSGHRLKHLIKAIASRWGRQLRALDTSPVMQQLSRATAAFFCVYSGALVALVCFKNWISPLAVLALVLSPTVGLGAQLAFQAMTSGPLGMIGGTAHSLITGMAALALTHLAVHAIMRSFSMVRRQTYLKTLEEVLLALSTPSLLQQLIGYRHIVRTLENVDKKVFSQVCARVNMPVSITRVSQSRYPVPPELRELLTCDLKRLNDTVTRKSSLIISGCTVLGEAICELLVTLPQGNECYLSPILRERVKAALQQICGPKFRGTLRYRVLARVLDLKPQAILTAAERLTFLNSLEGVFIAILTLAAASLRAEATLKQILHQSCQLDGQASTAASSPNAKYYQHSEARNNGSTNSSEELGKLIAVLEKYEEIPSCPPHSTKYPAFTTPCRQFRRLFKNIADGKYTPS